MAIFASKKLRKLKWEKGGTELLSGTCYKAIAVDTLEDAKELLSVLRVKHTSRYTPRPIFVNEKDKKKAFAIMLEIYDSFKFMNRYTCYCAFPMHVVLPNI